MIVLKSRSLFPPGGWQYRQPETGWAAPSPMASTFDQTVTQILKHRWANSHLNLSNKQDEIAAELDAYTCARLGNDPEYCTNLDVLPKAEALPATPQAAEQNPASRVDNVEGAKTIFEWFGAGGKPVEPQLAQARADICLKCPHNGGRKLFTGAIAAMVKSLAGVKAKMNLTVTGEDDLGSCVQCGCHIPTKIWVPLEHLTRSDDEIRFPEHCWIRKEKTP